MEGGIKNHEIKSDIEKFPKLRELIEGEPDAVFILVGAMKYTTGLKNRYENGAFGDPDENSVLSTGVPLATGGKDRMLAATEIHAIFPDTMIVPMSRTRDENKPTYASVTRDELIKKGVDEAKILLEEDSVSTITEYKEAARFCRLHKWKNVVFVSSNWHIPRCKALFNHIENFADNEEEVELLASFTEAIQSGELKVQFIGSTEVLSLRDNHYKNFFEKLGTSNLLGGRIAAEEKALKQIADGNYGNRSIPKKIYPDQI